jgi:hypothetical protein
MNQPPALGETLDLTLTLIPYRACDLLRSEGFEPASLLIRSKIKDVRGRPPLSG